MVFSDGMAATRAIRFPPGTYVLEAEDSQYWYMRSSTPLEFRIFRDGKAVDGRSIPGGIMIGKARISMVPAGGYIDGQNASAKVMVWKLGGEFVRREGRNWKKSF
jgi:hypothetical protein